MLKLIDRYLKHRAIKKYIRSLGPQLRQRYGISEYYTEGQIRTTLEHNKIGGKYAVYAYGLYLVPEQFDGILTMLNESKTSKSIRKHLAVTYVGGNIDYSYSDIMSTSEYCAGESSAACSDGGSSGGDCGGGDGGGGE